MIIKQNDSILELISKRMNLVYTTQLRWIVHKLTRGMFWLDQVLKAMLDFERVWPHMGLANTY